VRKLEHGAEENQLITKKLCNLETSPAPGRKTKEEGGKGIIQSETSTLVRKKEKKRQKHSKNPCNLSEEETLQGKVTRGRASPSIERLQHRAAKKRIPRLLLKGKET